MKPISIKAAVSFLRADDGEEGSTLPRIPRFSMLGYTGGELRQPWSRDPVVIDLAGMAIPSVLPIVFGHDYSLESVLGQATARVDGANLIVDGAILAETEAAGQVVTLGDKGYQWQASVGADVEESYVVPAGDTATINGRAFSGPVLIVKRSTLRECSFVTLGADAATAVQITAKAGESPMSDEMKAADGAPTGPEMQQENGGPTGPSDSMSSAAPKVDIQAVRAEVVADVTREVKAEILKDLRSARGPAIHASKPVVDEEKVTVAAMAMVGGLNVEKSYEEPVLEAAHKRSRTIGLQEVLISAARKSGYDGPAKITASNLRPILVAAFATHSISNVLAATYG